MRGTRYFAGGASAVRQRRLVLHVVRADPPLRLVRQAEPAVALAVVGPAAQREPGVVVGDVGQPVEVARADVDPGRRDHQAGITVRRHRRRSGDADHSTGEQCHGRRNGRQALPYSHLFSSGVERIERVLVVKQGSTIIA